MKRYIYVLTVIILLTGISEGQTVRKGFNFLSISDSADSIVTTVFASGDVKGLAAGENKEELATNGALGVSMAIRDILITASINVATTMDTLNNTFSNIILNPSNGSGLRSGLLDFRKKKIFNNFDLHLYATVSTSTWKIENEIKDVTVGGIGVLIERALISNNEENEVTLSYELGISVRSLMGELASNEEKRLRFLNTKNSVFGGLEGGMTIRVNSLIASLQFYYFIGDHVNGVTGGQLATGISISTDLFSFKSKYEQ
jgi:hypothetical protein